MITRTAAAAIRELNAIREDASPEDAHVDADAVLLSYLRGLRGVSAEVADAYDRLRERVDFWYA